MPPAFLLFLLTCINFLRCVLKTNIKYIIMDWAPLVLKKNKFQTKQNKVLCNRTVSAIHVCVLRFPDVRGFLASDIRDWIDHV